MTFAEVATPEYPPQPEGQVDLDPMRKTPLEWKLKKVWALASGPGKNGSRLYCGTLPGGLFTSDDQGASWQLVRSLWDHPERKRWFGGGMDEPGLHSISVHPTKPGHLAVAVSCGGVWVSEDDGESWQVRGEGMRAAYLPPDQAHDPVTQDPHCLVRCESDPEKFWVQHHNGIFRSVDGAESWQEVEKAGPSTFGFAVAVHPENADTAWFVPAQKDEHRAPVDGALVVTRTRDGGKSFDVLKEGLPQHHAYDLIYRHALDIDRESKTLAFGSTTGSLFVSEDLGDHWQCLNAHLPPIYCVRFRRTTADG